MKPVKTFPRLFVLLALAAMSALAACIPDPCAGNFGPDAGPGPNEACMKKKFDAAGTHGPDSAYPL